MGRVGRNGRTTIPTEAIVRMWTQNVHKNKKRSSIYARHSGPKPPEERKPGWKSCYARFHTAHTPMDTHYNLPKRICQLALIFKEKASRTLPYLSSALQVRRLM